MGNRPFRFASKRLATRSALCINLTALAVLSTFSLGMPLDVHAQEATVQINLPAQSLDNSLIQLGRQTDLQFFYTPQVVSGIEAPSVQGTMTPVQALERLLQGTPVQYRRDGKNIITLSRVMGEATQLAPVTVVGRAGDATEGSGSYTAQSVAAGSKISAALREVPRSISVITRQQLEDQQITNLDSVMEQMPGVTVQPSSGFTGSTYYVRGYQISSFLVDGSPAISAHLNDASVNTGTAKYDSVQLLRGPDAMFSGNGQPSGSINMVRKKPLSELQLKGSVSAGRWSNYYADVDLTGSLIDSGKVRGRIVAAHNDREYFFDNAHRKLSSLYGVVDIDLTDRTVLTLGASHDRERGSGRSTPPGFPRYSNGDALPVSRNVGFTSWSFSNLDTRNVFASLDHSFNDAWQARVNVSHTKTTLESNVSAFDRATDPISGLGGRLSPGTWAKGDFRNKTADAYLSGRFNFLGRKHQVIVGADYRDSTYDVPLFYSSAQSVSIPDWASVDPDGLIPSNSIGAGDWITAGETRQTGIYANGKFQLFGGLHAVVGGRYATYRTINNSRMAGSASNPIVNNKNDSIFTPYYALMYDIDDQWTAFFTTAESYEDQSNLYTADWRPLDPVTGRSFELGLKGELLDGRLNTNATIYRSKRENLGMQISQDPNFSMSGKGCCYIQGGKFISQGIELDIGGEVLPGWQINAGYTYDDNKTEYGDQKGERLASYTPKHIFRLWTSYQLHGRLSGLKIGGGVRMQSSFFRSGTVASWNPAGGTDGAGAYDGPNVSYKFTEPGRAIWSLFAEYRFNRNWTAALNVDNLFDKTYFQTVGSDTRNWYGNGSTFGEPRNIKLTLRGTF